jgi:hypothetical protein
MYKAKEVYFAELTLVFRIGIANGDIGPLQTFLAAGVPGDPVAVVRVLKAAAPLSALYLIKEFLTFTAPICLTNPPHSIGQVGMALQMQFKQSWRKMWISTQWMLDSKHHFTLLPSVAKAISQR